MEGVKGHHARASGWPERTTFKPATKDHHLWTEAAVIISPTTNCSHDQDLILHIYVHNTHSCCMMHKHHNGFSCESWKQQKLRKSWSGDKAALCMFLCQEPWRQDGNRKRRLGKRTHSQSWENLAWCMHGHDVPASKNMLGYIRTTYIQFFPVLYGVPVA